MGTISAVAVSSRLLYIVAVVVGRTRRHVGQGPLTVFVVYVVLVTVDVGRPPQYLLHAIAYV